MSSYMILALFSIVILFLIPLSLVYSELETDTNFLLYKAKQYMTLGEYEKAFSIYDNVLNIDSNNVEALFEKGNGLLNLAKYEEAIPYFEQILSLDPNRQIALIKLHDTLMKITDYRYGFIDGVLEIKVYDSHGNLIAYQNTKKILALEHDITKKYIKKWPVVQIETINNKKIAIHQQEFVEVLDRDTIFGFHQIPYSEKINLPLTSTWYYQIPVEKGDVVRYTYSIFMDVI